MLYLTCTKISSVDLAHYRVSHAKAWVPVDCGTKVGVIHCSVADKIMDLRVFTLYFGDYIFLQSKSK